MMIFQYQKLIFNLYTYIYSWSLLLCFLDILNKITSGALPLALYIYEMIEIK